MQKIHEEPNRTIFEQALEELNNAKISHEEILKGALMNTNKSSPSEIFKNVCSQSEDINLCTFVVGMCFFLINSIHFVGDRNAENRQFIEIISNLLDEIRKPCEELKTLIGEFGDYFLDYDIIRPICKESYCTQPDKELEKKCEEIFPSCEKNFPSAEKIIKYIARWYKLYTDYGLEIAAYYLRWFYEWSNVWVLAVFGEEGQADAKNVIKRIYEINKALSPEFLIQNGYFEETQIPTLLKIEDYKYKADFSDFKGELIGLLPYKYISFASVNEIITLQAAEYQEFSSELESKLATIEDENEKLKRANEILREKEKELTKYKKELTPEVQKILDKFDDLIEKLGKYGMDKESLKQAKKLYQSYGIGLDIILFPICQSVEHEMNVKFFDVVKDWLNVSDVKGGNYVKMLYSKDKPITLGYTFSEIENAQNANNLSKIQKKYYEFYYNEIIKKINAETEFKALYKISEEILIKKDNVELKFKNIRNTICHRGTEIEIIKKAESLISDILKFLSDTPAIFENIYKLNEKLSKFREENPNDAEQIKQSIQTLK